MNFFGRPSRHRGFFNRNVQPRARRAAPFGGLLLPIAGYLAWRNRDKLRAMFDQRFGQSSQTPEPNPV